MTAPRLASARRGFTLIEMTVVMALSAVVTLGIVAFYLSAQATWTDSSAQAVAQRDGTTLLSAISPRAREAASAIVVPNGVDPNNCAVVFYDNDGNELSRFKWFETDSLIHFADNFAVTGNYNPGPVVQTHVLRFHCSLNNAIGLMSVDTLRMQTATGQVVTLTTSYGLGNRP